MSDQLPHLYLKKNDQFENAVQVLLNTGQSDNLLPETKLLNIPNLLSCEEVSVVANGFDFVEFTGSGNKCLNGKLLLSQKINGEFILTELSSLSLKIPDELKGSDEPKYVSDLKKSLVKSWNVALQLALTKLTIVDKEYKHSTAKKYLSALNLTKKSNMVVAIAVIAIIVIIKMFSGENTSSPKSNKGKFPNPTPEQMALEQDEILNKAFKEIGIDREKLASDMSCFTE